MIDKTLNAVLDAAAQLSKTKNILVKEKCCAEASIFDRCRSFSMLDFLVYAKNMKKLSVVAASVEKDFEAYTADDFKAMADHMSEIIERSEEFLQTQVVPYERAQMNGKRIYGKDVDSLILSFWRVPLLFPYAPIMTLLALIWGVPHNVFESCLESIIPITEKETEIYGSDYAKAINIIVNDWRRHSTDYRSNRYQKKKPLYDERTETQDFWLMILFMKIQQELACYALKSNSHNKMDSCLNAFFDDFLDLWPYSPQIFFAIRDGRPTTVCEWYSRMNYFFENALQFEWSQKIDVIKSCKNSIYRIDERPWGKFAIAITDKECIVQKSSGQIVFWLMPGTPYFAAYYFIDDLNMYSMIHYKDQGDDYKKHILNILLTHQKILDKANDIFQQNYGMKLIPVPWEKTKHFDEFMTKTWSESKIEKEISSTYWDILLGTYQLHVKEYFDEPVPIEIEQPKADAQPNKGKPRRNVLSRVTMPPLRMAQYLGLVSTSHEPQDAAPK